MTASSKRTYHQYCGLAAALDIVGERWTLLIVRELLNGPRRYGELLANLSGLGTNLLADRLKSLTERGLIRQAEPAPGERRRPYELTAAGEDLRPAILALARWGLSFVADLPSSYEVRASWALLAIEAMIDPERAVVEEIYGFVVDDECFHVVAGNGSAVVVAGAAEHPVVTVHTDAITFVQIGGGVLSPLAAMATGRVVIEGENEAVLRACALLSLEGPEMIRLPDRGSSRLEAVKQSR